MAQSGRLSLYVAKLDEYRTFHLTFGDLFGGMVQVKISQLIVLRSSRGRGLLRSDSAPHRRQLRRQPPATTASLSSSPTARRSSRAGRLNDTCVVVNDLAPVAGRHRWPRRFLVVGSSTAAMPASVQIAHAGAGPRSRQPAARPARVRQRRPRLPTDRVPAPPAVWSIAALLVGSGSVASLLSRRRS